MVPAGPGRALPGRRRARAGHPGRLAATRTPPGNSSSGRCRKETTRAALVEKGYSSPTRRSIIDTPEFKQRMTHQRQRRRQARSLESIDLAARTGHMKYRTVHVYPQVDKQLDKAIELIASGQLSAKEAMAAGAGRLDRRPEARRRRALSVDGARSDAPRIGGGWERAAPARVPARPAAGADRAGRDHRGAGALPRWSPA